MSTDETVCVWQGKENPRGILDRHEPHCANGECKGCLACTEKHCVVCGWKHVDQQTCPKCVGNTRQALNDVRNLYAQLHAQALYGGSEGKLEAARPIPGGEAMVLLAPGSNGGALAWSKERGDDTTHSQDERVGEIKTPLMMLTDWEEGWRSIRHQETDDLTTVYAAAAYLDEHLTWAAQYHDDFASFVSELDQQVRHIEDVIHAGDRDDTGAPCMICSTHQIKVYGDTAAEDRWYCKRCKHPAEPGEYARSVASTARKYADRLNASDMEAEYRIRPGTLRVWVNRGKVRKRGFDEAGRKVYDVDDALVARDAADALKNTEAVEGDNVA